MNNYKNFKKGESLNFKFKVKEVDDYDDSIGTNMDDQSSESGSERKKSKRAYNSFNIFEILISEFLKCCRWTNLQTKSNANEKAYNIMFKKMDIITYVRNMIFFDITNQINIDNNNKTIFNFLSRPIISLEKNQKNGFDDLYRTYKEKDFKKFSDEIQNLAQKPSKNHMEDKLLSVSNEHLKIIV